jgi:hypothetical protein
MKAVILTYHSHNMFGPGYAENDHVALPRDLETITRTGGRVAPLAAIAAALAERRIDGEGDLLVGLSFDDGPKFDAVDFVHPTLGPQRGFIGILQDFRERHGAAAQPTLHATSFVIASPEARLAMQVAPESGYPGEPDWLGDSWWRPAVDTGLLEIGNHSWDHVHPLAPGVPLSVPQRGDFAVVNTYPDADAEIRRASVFIGERVGKPCRLFAYPYGHVSPYLAGDYLPHRRAEHGLVAAFGASGGAVRPDHSVWNIPRVVCGHDWKAPEALAALLRADMTADAVRP